ncbi:MAG: MgtC/SapB family protein [Proteobacteria bacterium]|nr:MgtC/SapB family protein [Pseudomonadota bacterium]
MAVQLTWQDIALRIGAAVLAGAIVGYDRGVRGRVAGLRTTILMCVAAAGAMVEGELLLSVGGKTPQSFAVMDVLRFPLGILSGIGFIGAGAIVRRGRLVTGVTTAATIWLMSVVGLILGAGYFLLGGVITAIAFAVLSLLKRLEQVLKREHRGQLILDLTEDGPPLESLMAMVRRTGLHLDALAVDAAEHRVLRFTVTWYDRSAPIQPPEIVEFLTKTNGVLRVRWVPKIAGAVED